MSVMEQSCTRYSCLQPYGRQCMGLFKKNSETGDATPPDEKVGKGQQQYSRGRRRVRHELDTNDNTRVGTMRTTSTGEGARREGSISSPTEASLG